MDLKTKRKEKGLTQAQVAIKCGVSMLTYQLWERGAVKTIKPENKEKLVKVLGLEG